MRRMSSSVNYLRPSGMHMPLELSFGLFQDYCELVEGIVSYQNYSSSYKKMTPCLVFSLVTHLVY